MGPNKTTLCQPLHRLTSSKVSFTWLPSDTAAFHANKQAFAEAVLLSFPDFDKPFHLYADAGGLQLGGIIMQEERILACYSRTLTEHQKNYTTMELELLSIVELLAEYQTMLLGGSYGPQKFHVPDGKNLRTKRWKLRLADYRLSMEYIKGNKNVGAVAFSRMRFETKEQATVVEEMYLANNNPECVMHGPVLREHQQNDKMIQQIHTACLAGTNNPDYRLLPLLGCMLVAYQQRIVLPRSLRDDLMDWYHQNLCHSGGTRQYKTMRQIFYWPGMDTMITKFYHKRQTRKRAKVHGGK
ncbi:polyprotein [Phytophthora megakarya]|uniref:Polyprotein n=1 Tax=Phytophthora megakarya TaxID=4795 RepID=A0A225VJF5_9STRA|nr:polyprotein [Phytophthora megakarya]